MVKKPKAEAAEAAVEAVEEVEKAEPVKEDGFFVYLGPSIRGVIQTASIYTGTRAEAEQFLAGAIEKFPRIKQLLISDKTLPEDRAKVKTPGNYLNEVYRKLVADVKKKEG